MFTKSYINWPICAVFTQIFYTILLFLLHEYFRHSLDTLHLFTLCRSIWMSVQLSDRWETEKRFPKTILLPIPTSESIAPASRDSGWSDWKDLCQFVNFLLQLAQRNLSQMMESEICQIFLQTHRSRQMHKMCKWSNSSKKKSPYTHMPPYILMHIWHM